MKSTMTNNDSEPPSCLRPIFMIGQDSRGNWVVRDKSGIRGGLFVDRTEALRYIRSESEDSALIAVAGCLELDMAAPVVVPPVFGVSPPPERRVA